MILFLQAVALQHPAATHAFTRSNGEVKGLGQGLVVPFFSCCAQAVSFLFLPRRGVIQYSC